MFSPVSKQRERTNPSVNVGPSLGDAEFEFIRHVVNENAGIVLGPNKRQLVQGRLARRLRELGLPSYEAYCDHVRESGPEERENHHFQAMAAYMIPEALKRNDVSRRLRIWSAGCSTGEEAYCLAMVLHECLPPGQRWDAKILATDIDSDVIEFARAGIYPMDRLESVSQERLRRYFRRGVGPQAGNALVAPEIKRLVTFNPLNLLKPWPMRGPFDIIFCRNVMIYFDQLTRETLVSRFGSMLVTDGYLCLGHSESIHGGSAPFRLVGKTIYRKTGEMHGG
jgi:chemotaxis protein methyltransferase CheR